MKKKLIAAISALCIVGTAFVTAANTVNAEPAHREQKTEQTASQDRIYNIASVSKMYSALAVMQLADEGKVELDAPVTEYLPEFEMNDERYKKLTVRMLMDHTNGLAMGSGINHYLYDDVDSFVHDSILEFTKNAQFKADPGEYPCYGNYGFFLLELITENVSGMSYTDYVRENIASKIRAEHTGTAWALYDGDLGDSRAELYSGALPVNYPYEMAAGPGGIYASAPDVADFGAAFFTGNDVLLSDDAKSQMRTRQSGDTKSEGYGLGWDFVEQVRYEKENVKVCGKGGDMPYMHSFLLVAPDEQISCAVLTAGNASSTIAGLMAEALMDIALEEQGITITHKDPACKKTLSTIPKSYQKYEGLYGGGSDVYRVTFPDMAYMQVQCLTNEIQSITHYLYTTEDTFVRMQGRVPSGNASEDPNQEVVSFRQRNGKDYICKDALNQIEQLGSLQMAEYGLQRLDETPVDAAAQKAWDERNGSRYYLYNELAASCYYLLPSQKLFVTDGYVSSCRITDETHAVHALQIPGNSGRDLTDLSIVQTDDGELLQMSSGTAYLAEKDFPVLTGAVRTVPLHTQQAGWYRIGDDMANKTITLDLPEKSAVYVYDRYDKPIYSSFMLDCADHIPLPSGGHIVFLGETGSSIEITS